MRAVLVAALFMAFPAAAQSHCAALPPGLVINEFLPDPDGADSTALGEWVELYNGTGEYIELTGVRIYKATQGDSYGLEATLPDELTIAPGSYYVVGEANVPGADFVVSGTMGLGSGANGDGVRLVDCVDNVLDTVVYGDQDNGQAVVDDSGSPATSLAPKPGTGETVARREDGVDTDASGEDFWVPTTVTRGSANPTPPVCTPSSGGVTINEFVANPAGADQGSSGAYEEFVELYNSNGTTVSLAGWRIEGATSSSWSTKHTFTASASIGAQSWIAVGETNVFAASIAVAELALGSGSNGDGLRLVDCEGTVVDTVVYGEDNDDGIEDDRGRTDSYADKPGDDEAIARVSDGVDTDRSGDDFFLTLEQTPGARNPSAPVCVGSTGDVVINEFLANPPGADGEVALEWVELYNGGDDDLVLDDWVIGVATSGDSYSERGVLPVGTVLPADGHLLIGEANVSGADVIVASLGLGSGLRADGVRLMDCDGRVVDTVVYGDASNEDGVVDDSGAAATGVAPTPGDGVALARRRDGLDTDDSGSDFVGSSNPTPGASNPVFECFPSTGDVLLNEFLPDPDGSDGDAKTEWVELYNRSGDTLRVDGWQLVFASNGDDSAPDVLFPPESAVAPLGFFVVGDENAPNTDTVAPMSIGNGSGADAIRLIDCEGTLVDVVIYGDANEDNLTDESGAVGESTGKPGSNESLARAEDGADTDNAADWVVDRSPTPGASNVDEPGSGGDTGNSGGSGGGCNRGAPDGDAPGGCGERELSADRGGCRSMPLPLGGFEVMLAGLIALRRRRSAR